MLNARTDKYLQQLEIWQGTLQTEVAVLLVSHVDACG